MGINIINIGLTATPTVGLYVLKKKATGGIMVSASHNNIEWNALKFFNKKGEFITKEESEYIINFDIKTKKNDGRKVPGRFISWLNNDRCVSSRSKSLLC